MNGQLMIQIEAGNAAASTTEAQLAEWMVGHAVATRARQPAQAVGEVVCALHDVHTAGSTRERLRGVSLELRAGEIVAVAGVSGNGQVALAELLSGLRVPSHGEALVFGEPVDAWVVAGGTLILVAISFITWRESVVRRRSITPPVPATKV